MRSQNSLFCSLIEQLNAKLIVFIENEFVIETEAEFILSNMTMLNNKDLSLLVEDLGNYSDLEEFLSLLIEFIELFNEESPEVSLDENKYRYLETGHIISYLEVSELNDIKEMAVKLKTMLDSVINNTPEISELFLKYGIGRTNEDYKPFLREINKLSSRSSVRFYTNISNDTQNTILIDINRVLQKGEFCLFIVDNKLEGTIEGEEYIKSEILKLRNDGLNVVSIIFTSDQKDRNRNEIKDYYTFQISKREHNAIESVTKNLALSAYAHMFDKLREIHKFSVDRAHDLAISRPSNMIYLASMAGSEGITVFEAVNNWLELVRNERVTSQLLESTAYTEYHYISGLCNLINDSFVEDSEGIEEGHIDEQSVFHLNTFEIFDYSVNEFGSPPSPGDIFEDKGNYYVLVGQDCDFTIRNKDTSRNIKTAELLRCSFIESPKMADKVKVELNKIELNYFQDSTGEKGVLEIYLNKPLFADFLVLDTCTFNRDGSCKIYLNQELDQSILRVLPKPWESYYKKLQKNISSIANIIKQVDQSDISSLDLNDISVFDISKRDDDLLQYSLKRICRLKGKFKDLLVNNYWNYRGRVGLNTTNITDFEMRTFSKIWVKLVGEDERMTTIDYNVKFIRSLNRDKNRELKKLPLEIDIGLLKEHIDAIKDIEGDTIIIEKEDTTDRITKIKFLKKFDEQGNLEGIKIVVPYFNFANGKHITKEEVSILDLLDETSRDYILKNKDEKIECIINQENVSLRDEKEKIKSFSISKLKGGVLIPFFNKKITFYDGKIVVNTIFEDEIASSKETT